MNRSQTILRSSLGIALVVGVCVPGLAQSNTQKEASFTKVDPSTQMANLASPSTSAGKSSERKSMVRRRSLPGDAHGPISAALGKDDSGYWVYPNANGFRGENLRQALVAEFTRRGAEVRSHNMRWGLETRGYGYGDALRPVNAVAPQASANRVEYRRDSMTEWYENGPLGLEQGFTLAHPPAKSTGEPLTLELALHGDLVAAVESTGTSLELRGKDGRVALRYAGLKARDATARDLRSWLEVRGERLLLRVEDGEARYPLVVDPWIQQGELTATDGAAGDYFGQSIAVSGNTIVVGAPQHMVGSNSTQGAAYVFLQTGGTWSLQAELTASDGAAFDQFGSSVAVDGNTIVVGARGRTVGSNNSQGAVYVFAQSGGTWSQQAELTAADSAAYNYFGNSVALSGSTIVIGAPGHGTGSNTSQGAAYVFTQSGTNWSQQAELTASDAVAYDELGYSVAVSGSTALLGAPCHPAVGGCGPGAAYVFVESGGTWSQQAELAASDGVPQDEFGSSVALDVSTVVVGAHLHTVGSNQNYQGAAYVFVQSGGTWSQQAELSPSDSVSYDTFGFSVAVKGSTALFSAYCHPAVSQNTCGPGAAYVFMQSGGTWSQQTELTASDGAENDFFGWSVALDGSTAVGGAPHHTVGSNQFQGAAYVFGSTGPMYALSASPNSLTVAQGNQVTNTITIAPENGFSGSVSLSASGVPGLPFGVTAAFNPNPATSNSTLTLTASAMATPDTVTLRVTGTSGNLTQTTTLPLTVTGTPVPNYALSAIPSNLNMTQGNQGTSTITIAPLNGFSGNVSLSASGLPSGVSAAFNPNPATSSSTLTLTASATATPYAGTVTVTGTSGNLTQTTTLTLTLTGPQDFTLGASSGSPTSQTVSAGQAASFMLTLASINSFSGTVNLNCAITPSVTTAPPTCTLSGSSVQVSSGGTQSVTANVGTTASVTTSTAAYLGFPPRAMPLAGMLLLLGSVGLLLRNFKRLPAFAVTVILALAFCVSCGGNSSYQTPPPHTTPGTPSGTYTVTITATSGNLSHNLALQVIVQ